MTISAKSGRRGVNNCSIENSKNTSSRSNDDTFDEKVSDENDESTTKHALHDIGVDVLEPITRQQERLAEAMGEFASFVLYDEQEACQAIVDRHMELCSLREKDNESSSNAPNIGELQGGSDEFDIYRLSIPAHHHHHGNNDGNENDDDDDENAAVELLQAFHASRQGKEYRTILTFDTLKQYMLNMCERRSHQRHRHDYDDEYHHSSTSRRRYYTQLGNFMLILSFGPTHGQPRHIDHMHPNLPIFLYMSEHCPSTIIYDTRTTNNSTSTAAHHQKEESEHAATSITNTQELLEHWQRECSVAVPTLLETLLLENAHTKLRDRSSPWWPNLQYFSFWHTIDTMLQHFGKLYLSVYYARPLALTATRPGTTMLVGGGGGDDNHVHAGPPTVGPRLFAFAVGIPEESDDDDDDDHDHDHDDHDYQNRSSNNNNVTNGSRTSSSSSSNKEEMADGEVQYNPVLFHADLCCILFTLMDFHFHECCSYRPTLLQQEQDNDNDTDDEKEQSKRFLIQHVLVPLVKGLVLDCNDRIDYERLLGDERQELRDWLQRLTSVLVVEDGESKVQVNGLVQEAVESTSCIFYSPDVLLLGSRNSKKKKTRRKDKRRQKKQASGSII